MQQDNKNRKFGIRLALPGAILALLTYPLAAVTVWITSPDILTNFNAQIAAGLLGACSLCYLGIVWSMGSIACKVGDDSLLLKPRANFASTLVLISLLGSFVGRIILHPANYARLPGASAETWLYILAGAYLAIWGYLRTRYFVKILQVHRPGYYSAMVADQLFRTLIVMNLATMCALSKTMLAPFFAFITTMAIFPVITFIESKYFK